MNLSYPINYNYESILTEANYKTYFIINFVSDLLNYIVFLLIHLIIDIGMVVKLRQTLNEKLENTKEYITKEQQEKRQTESELAMDNAIFMVILNTIVSVLLKLPTCVYSLIFMYYNIYKLNGYYMYYNPRFGIFFKLICMESYFCDMLLTMANFLYLLHISIQFFFFKRFDKKFKTAFDRILIK